MNTDLLGDLAKNPREENDTDHEHQSLVSKVSQLSLVTTDSSSTTTASTTTAAAESSVTPPSQVKSVDPVQEHHVSTIDPNLLPENWPKHVKYLTDYEYHSSTPSAILDLVLGRRRANQQQQQQQEEVEGAQDQDNLTTEQLEAYDEIPIGHAIPAPLRSTLNSNSTQDQEPPYQIKLITSPPNHPVLGSYGLFATKTLRPGLHLLDYISLVVPDDHANPDSDHTLYLCNDLNLDASAHGNHGRFVNDFRGIRTQAQGPNVAWDLYRDEETGQARMGCKVLKRIQPGEEILCTYGKAYWKSRNVNVVGKEWEDEWDTDLEDQSDSDSEQNVIKDDNN